MDHNPASAGGYDGPVNPENYKRAVYRQAPSRFTVEMLPPAKQGGTFSFGMRITAVHRGDRVSVSSRSSQQEYDIWRRWEDCLCFQDTLETEYARLAKEKKQRLLHGKGIKKNGIYMQDRASSWESLPPGPDPHSVAKDIHDYLPHLTKKGTIFRPSQATVDQRQAELTALVEALWADDLPTLVLDMRKDRLITDFFGYWRRDVDLARKSPRNTGKQRSGSITPSIFSTYFSSSPTVDEESSIPTLPRSPGSAPANSSSSSLSSEERVTRRRAVSAASSDSSSIPSSRSSKSSMTSISFADEVPVTFGHNPHQAADDRTTSMLLQSLPEDCELSVKQAHDSLMGITSRRRQNSVNGDTRVNTDGPSHDAPPRAMSSGTRLSNNRACRESWQTTASGMSFLDGIGVTLPDSLDEISRRRESVASFATFMTDSSANAIISRSDDSRRARTSVATFMTDRSEDAVIPRSPRRTSSRTTLRRSASVENRMSTLTITDRERSEPWSDPEDDDVLDAYFYDAFPRPCSFIPQVSPQRFPRPEAPLGQISQSNNHLSPMFLPESSPISATPSSSIPSSISNSPMSPQSSFSPYSPVSPDIPVSPRDSPRSPRSVLSVRILSENGRSQTAVPPSPTTSLRSTALSFSTVSDTSSVAASGTLVIKAAHNNSIILLRASREITFAEARQRLSDKFMNQEGVRLTPAFTLAFVVPSITTQSRGAMGRSNSLSSARSPSDVTKMRLITSETEWERVISSIEGNGKLTLRVLDTDS